MMHVNKRHIVAVAWFVVVASLVVSYGAIVAGFIGYATASAASLVIFSAVMAGCLAAFVFLIVGTRQLRNAS